MATLAQTFRSDFDAPTRTRGEHYARSGRVTKLVMHGPRHFTALVKGSDLYEVDVLVDGDEDGSGFPVDDITSECACPVGYNCKHGVAALVIWAAKVGHSLAPMPALTAQNRSAPPAQPAELFPGLAAVRNRAWRGGDPQVQVWLAELGNRQRAAGANGEGQWLVFNAEPTDDGLRIMPLLCRRLKSGARSAGKRFSSHDAFLNRPPECATAEDERLVKLLDSVSKGRSSWRDWRRRGPEAFPAAVLEQALATGRLHWGGDLGAPLTRLDAITAQPALAQQRQAAPRDAGRRPGSRPGAAAGRSALGARRWRPGAAHLQPAAGPAAQPDPHAVDGGGRGAHLRHRPGRGRARTRRPGTAAAGRSHAAPARRPRAPPLVCARPAPRARRGPRRGHLPLRRPGGGVRRRPDRRWRGRPADPAPPRQRARAQRRAAALRHRRCGRHTACRPRRCAAPAPPCCGRAAPTCSRRATTRSPCRPRCWPPCAAAAGRSAAPTSARSPRSTSAASPPRSRSAPAATGSSCTSAWRSPVSASTWCRCSPRCWPAARKRGSACRAAAATSR